MINLPVRAGQFRPCSRAAILLQIAVTTKLCSGSPLQVKHQRDTRNWICQGANCQCTETKSKFVQVGQVVFWHAGCFIKQKKVAPRFRLETARG